ncbi:MAG: TonB-dependent receptor [Acidobacteriota bacterium]|nr:TonB-dependent receptor [Acidobacteriota bacterium]
MTFRRPRLAGLALAAGITLPSLLAGIAHPLAAQATSAPAAISGTILDPSGAPLPGAVLLLREESSGVSRKLTSDAQGRFSVTGLAPGRYTVQVDAPGFMTALRTNLQPASGRTQDLSISLALGNVSQQVTVEASEAGSVAAALAPMDALLDATSARTEIGSAFIQNFTSPEADFSELIQHAPGTFSVNPNGVGLGDSKTFFRGFSDGSYDITFDGIPFNDTNDPSHHSWAFFPSPWIGGIDFDRSPGDATTIGPAPYGGSINLLSRELSAQQNLRASISYGSFNTLLRDFQYDSGNFGGITRRNNLFADVHELTSDGYQTFNAQQRIGGSLKYRLRLSDRAALTGFAGVLLLDTNTPDAKTPTRGNIALHGRNFLLSSDPANSLFYGYNSYHVPTDFEYIQYRSQIGKGWDIDVRPYTMSYNNAQYFANAPSTLGGVVTAANCVPVANKQKVFVSPCATNKTNTYRKYGENTMATQVSRFGILRTGLWYEWAATDRFQNPSTPFARTDDALPNFHEKFWTNSYNPYAEYQLHATRRLDVTGGLKYARYTQDLKQYADNGKTVGLLGGTPVSSGGVTTGLTGGAPFVRNYGGYGTWLPSASAHFRIRNQWTAYGQFATGSVIPPSGVFDVTGSVVSLLPAPTTAKTYQTGSVLKFRRVTLDADVFYTHFQNTYVSSPDPNNTSATLYQQGGDSVSKGFEAETNVYLGRGLSFYGNGTAGSARYVSQTINGAANSNYQHWVANTPSNTESLGMTYQQRFFDIGIFNKRVGPLWNDAKGTSGTVNQVIPIDPFNVTNFFINYTIRNGSHFDQTRLKLSFNNLFNSDNTVAIAQAAKANTYTPGPNDNLTLLPPRSLTLTVTFGLSPKR